MIYEYNCKSCNRIFDVVKSVKDMESSESCECGEIAVRQFVPRSSYFIGTKVEHAEYNPGLGCIVRNSQHRKELCKEKGLIEIGNEKPEKLHSHFEKKREEAREKSWEEEKGWVGNGE